MFYDAIRQPESTEDVIDMAVLYARSAAALLPLLNDYDHPDWEPIRGMFITANDIIRTVRSKYGHIMISGPTRVSNQSHVYMQNFISDITYIPGESTFSIKRGREYNEYDVTLDVNSEEDIFMKSTLLEYRPLFCAAYFSTLRDLNIQQPFTVLPMGLEYAIDAHPTYMNMMRSKLK